MNSRRSFLRVLGAAPLAARAAAEEASKSLAGIGRGGSPLGGEVFGQPATNPPKNVSPKDIANMLLDKAFRAQVESLAYKNNRYVSYIDVDLATKKSFSLAAKVTFQRQRNVAREIEGHSTEWESPWSLFCKRMSPFG